MKSTPMKQEQILDILNNSQKEFNGVNEANLDSADILAAMFEKQKLEFAIEQLKEFKDHYQEKIGTGKIWNRIKELEQKIQEL